MSLFTRKNGLVADAFFRWMPSAIAATACFMAVYGSMQQAFRMSADDPQIALARQEADALAKGAALPGADRRMAVDVATSPASFVAVYDVSGAPLAGTGLLDGKIPAPPIGVLEASKRSGENRVTWQPRPDVRIAAVVVPTSPGSAGYVLVGRSLRESERRTAIIGGDLLAGWLVALLASLSASYYAARREAGRTA
ncbi:MAG: hypothetical protein RL272_981 [Candidatus Parcubacteria bacterium]|jgi:hypothetical protein